MHDDGGGERSASTFDSILGTIEAYEAIITPGYGAILYSRAAVRTALPGDLHAAAVATSLGIDSLDYARRMYASEYTPASSETVVDAFSRVVRRARELRVALAARLTTNSRSDSHYGTFAAAVALQRLDSGFRAAQILYRLGLNLEGDAVARQVLEQIAWSLGACHHREITDVERVKATEMRALKGVLPEVAKLYGGLSETAHARLAQHRANFEVADERGWVVLSTPQLSVAARLILTLTDAWAVAFEITRANHLDTFDFVFGADRPQPDANRRFLVELETLVGAVEALERSGSGDLVSP
jgi:hypothetical protein